MDKFKKELKSFGQIITGLMMSAFMTLFLFSIVNQVAINKPGILFYMMIFILVNIFFHLGVYWEKRDINKINENTIDLEP